MVPGRKLRRADPHYPTLNQKHPLNCRFRHIFECTSTRMGDGIHASPAQTLGVHEKENDFHGLWRAQERPLSTLLSTNKLCGGLHNLLDGTNIPARSRGFNMFPQIIPAATTPRNLIYARPYEAPAGTPAGELSSHQLCRPSSRAPCLAENACQSSPRFCCCASHYWQWPPSSSPLSLSA